MKNQPTHSSLDSDEWLMAEVARGRAQMLEPLVRRYGTLLLSFICRMVRDRQKAEDIFQDVFLAVWRRRNLYRYPRPFKPWLYSIAINRVRELHRRKGEARAWPAEEAPEPVDAGAGGSSPSDSAIATETSLLIQQAVAALPPRQQMVVAMRMWKGNSYAEIAEAMGIRESTVRSNMHDALAAIRKVLETRM